MTEYELTHELKQLGWNYGPKEFDKLFSACRHVGVDTWNEAAEAMLERRDSRSTPSIKQVLGVLREVQRQRSGGAEHETHWWTLPPDIRERMEAIRAWIITDPVKYSRQVILCEDGPTPKYWRVRDVACTPKGEYALRIWPADEPWDPRNARTLWPEQLAHMQISYQPGYGDEGGPELPGLMKPQRCESQIDESEPQPALCATDEPQGGTWIDRALEEKFRPKEKAPVSDLDDEIPF